jgi:RNase H-fold protein (predicted Holliday junction resolvase)
METNVKNNNSGVAAISPVKADKVAKFVAGNPVNAVSKAEPAKEEVKKEADKVPAITPQQPEPPKAEAPKAEVKAERPKKIVLNLEGTLKFIEEMHRKAKQRTKLQDTIKNLDDFEIELRDEADTTDTNYYNGCVLTIEDDNRRKFETKNPTIIWTVAQLVNNMCIEKLAEIEAGIVIPQ